MIVKERPVVLYDIEVFPNCFHCTCKDSESHKLYKFEISCRKNQLEELVDFFYTNRTDHIMCGYNNKHYDDIIISYIIHFCSRMKRLGYSRICSSLYYLSKEIISSEKTGNIDKIKVYKYSNYFYSFDLMLMLYPIPNLGILIDLNSVLECPGVLCLVQ